MSAKNITGGGTSHGTTPSNNGEERVLSRRPALASTIAWLNRNKPLPSIPQNIFFVQEESERPPAYKQLGNCPPAYELMLKPLPPLSSN